MNACLLLTSTFEQATNSGEFIHTSAISIVEIGYLVEKYRLPEVAWQRLIETNNDNDINIVVIPVNLEIRKND